MLRTDHQYPPTRRMPLGPPECRDSDMGELALTLPAPLPPQIEELRPTFTDPGSYERWADRLTEDWGAYRGIPAQTRSVQEAYNTALREALDTPPKPPRRVPWLACVISAALFALGYWLGKMLP